MTKQGPTGPHSLDERTEQASTSESACSFVPSRRRFVQTLAAGGSLLLAGCGQGLSDLTGPGDDAPTPTTGDRSGVLPRVKGQTFRVPTRQDPTKTSVYGWTTVNILQRTAYARVVKEPATYGLRRFLRPPGVWINGQLGGPRPNTTIQYTWIEEPIEITSNETTVTIADDATWSDGQPITGRDLVLRPLEASLHQYATPPAYAPEVRGPYDERPEPQRIVASFDDFEVGERTVTYRSSTGQFEQLVDTDVALALGPVYPTLSPTHIAPFDAYADAVIETAQRAQAGDIYPWYGAGFGDPNRQSLIKEHLAEAKYVRKFSKPDNVVGTGVWDLVDIDGTDFVFEPNPHHRHADSINFDEVRFGFSRSVQRQRAALTDDRLDLASPGTTPQTVVDAFPDSIKPLRSPGGLNTGNELAIDHDHPALGQRSVRQALMYVLDHKMIANNIHPSVAIPVDAPGADTWYATSYANQDWLNQHFTTYGAAHQKATQLMEQVGYTDTGGQWVDADGEALTLTLPTTSDTPTWETTVASQLTTFGIDTTVRTMGSDAFANRRDKGEFTIWPKTNGSGVAFAENTLSVWGAAARNPDRFGIYPDKQFKTGKFSRNGTPLPKTEERYRVFTIEAPPVGRPDGPLQTYHPAALTIASWGTLSRKEFIRRVKIGMWLANWYLPTLPINKRYIQHFIDAGHWVWPTDSTSWKSFVDGDYRTPKGFLGDLQLQANPDNPEAGATVDDE